MLTVRYIFDDARNPLATGRFLAGAIFDVPSRNNNLGVTYTRNISSRFTNEARFNFSRLFVSFGDTTSLPGPSIQFSGTRSLASGASSLSFGTQNNLPQSRKVDVYQAQDTLISTIGNHKCENWSRYSPSGSKQLLLAKLSWSIYFYRKQPYSNFPPARVRVRFRPEHRWLLLPALRVRDLERRRLKTFCSADRAESILRVAIQIF